VWRQSEGTCPLSKSYCLASQEYPSFLSFLLPRQAGNSYVRRSDRLPLLRGEVRNTRPAEGTRHKPRIGHLHWCGWQRASGCPGAILPGLDRLLGCVRVPPGPARLAPHLLRNRTVTLPSAPCSCELRVVGPRVSLRVPSAPSRSLLHPHAPFCTLLHPSAPFCMPTQRGALVYLDREYTAAGFAFEGVETATVTLRVLCVPFTVRPPPLDDTMLCYATSGASAGLAPPPGTAFPAFPTLVVASTERAAAAAAKMALGSRYVVGRSEYPVVEFVTQPSRKSLRGRNWEPTLILCPPPLSRGLGPAQAGTSTSAASGAAQAASGRGGPTRSHGGTTAVRAGAAASNLNEGAEYAGGGAGGGGVWGPAGLSLILKDYARPSDPGTLYCMTLADAAAAAAAGLTVGSGSAGSEGSETDSDRDSLSDAPR
jgi:hypothetical protein